MGKIKRSKRESDSEYVVAYLISKDKGIISHNFFFKYMLDFKRWDRIYSSPQRNITVMGFGFIHSFIRPWCAPSPS